MKNTLSVLFAASMLVILTSIVAAIGLAASDSRSDSTLTIATRDAQHRFTIELDDVVGRIYEAGQRRHDLAIHAHTTAGDHVFAIATCADAGFGHRFLEANA